MNKKIALIMAAVTALSVLGFAGQRAAHVKADRVKGTKSKGEAKMPAEAKFATETGAMRNPKLKSKGAANMTYLHVDNRTDYNIYIYVDDQYVGSVGPFGDSYGWQYSGTRKLYAVSAGGTTSWGPRWYSFVDGATFTWTLE